MNTPVSPGDKIFPRMTAAWFNDTIKSNDAKAKNRRGGSSLGGGELLCVAQDTGTERFNPVGVTDLGSENVHQDRTPFVSGTNVDQHNWVIPQEDLSENAGVMCVVCGLTRAWVTTTNSDDNCVIYDPDTSKLITAKRGKAHILVKGNTSFPSLIHIGPQINCTEALGYVGSALVGTTATVTVNNLVGINFTADELGASVTARNIHAWTADSGALAQIKWAYGLQEWIIYQVTCPGDPIYTLP